ncbi:MAG: hypothetical protein WD825_17265 [Gemmatimonadaceae bacterium]
MPGFTPNEGEKLIADILYKRDLTDRIADLELGLFTNAAVDETTTHADLTEPVGTGYARKNLVDANWTGATDTRSHAMQTFTGGAGGWAGTVKGYFICTKGATKRLVHIEVDPNGPYTINENDTYDVTPNNTIA